jgi:uncharacterized membrane protein YdbT with pleckstrin-like domain
MSDVPQNKVESPSGVDIEWSYSGKSMRAQALLYVILSLVLIGLGVYATIYDGKVQLPALTAWYIITGLLVLLWGYFYTLYFYRVYTIRYRLTERHLYRYRGLFTRTSDSMELIHINDVRLVQTLFDRIFNGGVGRLVIYCPQDKTDAELVLTGIDKPREIFEKIDSLRTALRTKRSILPSGA